MTGRLVACTAAGVLAVGACTTAGEPATSRPPARSAGIETVAATTATVPATPPAAGAVPSTTTPQASPALDSVAGIAGEISATERGIRRPGTDDASLRGLGERQQRAYRALAGRSEWDEQVAAALPPDVAVPFWFNVAARRAVQDHSAARAPVDPPPTVPAWTIVEPLPVDVLRNFYQEAEDLTGVPWEYLAAIHLVETRMGRIVGASAAGAIGPMQFLPSTWAECCAGDPLDAHDAIVGAAQYLRSRGAPADLRSALYAYNPNEGYVGAVSAYAANLAADERALLGYHGWEVYVTTTAGSIRLPVGYSEPAPIDAAAYLASVPPAADGAEFSLTGRAG